jgi:hypothetical protein
MAGGAVGRFGYSGLKEAALRGSLWVLNVIAQMLMLCNVAVGDWCRAALKARIRPLYLSMVFRDLSAFSLHLNPGLAYLNAGRSYV